MNVINVLCILFVLACVSGFKYAGRPKFKCFPISEPLCSDFPYNYTTFPNILGHDNADDASDVLYEYKLLLDTHCSTHLRFFLCSLHFPMCTPKVEVAIPGCRSMCEKVRADCEPVMRVGGVQWPDTIDCSKLPMRNEKKRLCMVPPGESPNGEAPKVDTNPQPPSVTLDESGAGPHIELEIDDEDENDKAAKYWAQQLELNPGYEEQQWREPIIPRIEHQLPPEEPVVVDEPEGPGFGFASPPQREPDQDKNQFVTISQPKPRPNKCKNPNKFHYLKRMKQCVPRCEKTTDILFSSNHKQIAYWLLFSFSLLCFISTVMTVCTFMIDSKRFRYPERPIIFLSICYCVYSVAYLVRSVNGPLNSMACMEDITHPAGASYFVKGGIQGTGCTAMFFVLYYFGMAASAWWVVLTLSWLLSAGFKWGHEAIEAYGFYFHLAAWLLPAGQTIVVLILGKVDGDELTGVCYVGNLEPESLMYFVIIPLTFYLITGTVALVFGFGYLFKIRRVIRHQGGKSAGKLEKLMWRIGVFSVLYTVPAACVVAVNFYQYQNLGVWMSHARKIPCRASGSPFLYRPDSAPSEFQGSWLPPRDNYQASMAPATWRGYPQRSDYLVGDGSDFYAYEPWPEQPGYDRYTQTNGKRKRRSLPIKDQIPRVNLDCTLPDSIPSLPIFGIKIFMSLIAGITSGMWIWSGKTVESWRKFYKTCRCGKSPKATQVGHKRDGGFAV
uniref:frizzled-10-B-like n=1 Tax=Ciona intestinalis TaxID=7719 RepID=UPI000180CC71|nr:frizzled-10-B-like [Ciona intestinalis]|eukprot:XP_026692846.1 frizzled-10-B-like [Ciona intestinalis]